MQTTDEAKDIARRAAALRFPRAAGVAQVLRTSYLSPRMLRLVLGGEDVAAFPCEGPGEIVTLMVAPPGGEVVLPLEGWRFGPEADGQEWRNYTVRRHDARAGELVIDVVVHDPPHGPALRWAVGARPGDRVGIAGPRPDFRPHPGAAWALLAGDETALPSIGAALEWGIPAPRVQVVVEVHDLGERAALDAPAGTDVIWVSRDGAPAGTGTGLLAAIRSLDLGPAPGQAFVAGEAFLVRGVRRHLREERGMPADRVRAVGYWKADATPEVEDDDEDG